MGSLYKHGAQSINEFARFVFLEEVVEGRRVLLVEDQAPLTLDASEPPPLADFLLSLGARKVVVAVSDKDRLSALRDGGKRRELDYRALRDDELPGDDGAFDLVIDFDLPKALARDEEHRMGDIDRVLSDNGFALTSLSTDATGVEAMIADDRSKGTSIGYRDLAERLSDNFDDVEVFFQSMLLGFFFGSFSADSETDGISPQTALMGEEAEPAVSYLFAFGRAVPVVEDVSLVQLPFQEILSRLAAGKGNALELASDTAAVQSEVQELRRENERRGLAITDLAGRVPRLKTEIDGLLSQLDKRTKERDLWQARIGELERQLQEKKRAHGLLEKQSAALAKELSSGLSDEERARYEDEEQALRQDLEQVRDAFETAKDDLEAKDDALNSLQTKLAQVVLDLEKAQSSLEELSAQRATEKRDSLARRSALETKLMESNSRISELETSLEDGIAAEAMAKERAEVSSAKLAVLEEQAKEAILTIEGLEKAGLEKSVAFAEAEAQKAELKKETKALEKALEEAMASSLAYASEYERTQEELEAFKARKKLIEEERETANELFALIESERDALTQSVRALQARVEDYEREHKEQKLLRIELEAKIVAQKTTIESVRKQNADQKHLNDAQKQAHEKRRKEDEQKLTKLAAGVHFLLEERAKRTSAMASLLRNAELSKAQIENAQNQLKSRTEALARAREKAQTSESESAHIQAQLRSLTRELQGQQTKFEAQKELLDDLAEQRDTLQRVVSTREKEANEWKSQLADAQTERAHLQESIRAFEQKESGSVSQIRKLENDLIDIMAREETLSLRVSSVLEKNDDAKLALDKAIKERDALIALQESEQAKSKHLAAENERLQNRIRVLSDEKKSQEDFEHELERVREERFALDTEAKKATAECERLKAALENADRAARELTQASQEAKGELEKARVERDEAVSKNEVLALELEGARNEIRENEEELHESRAASAHAKARAQNFKAQLQAQQSRSDEYERRLSELEGEIGERESARMAAEKEKSSALAERDRLKDEIVALENAWSETEKELRVAIENDQSALVASLKASLAQQNAQRANNSQEASRLDARVLEAENTLKHEQERRVALEERAQEAEAQLDAERELRVALKEAAEKQQQAFEQEQARSEMLEAHLQELQSVAERENAERALLEETLQEARQTFIGEQAQRETLEATLAQARQAFAQEQAQRETLEATLAQARQTFDQEHAQREMLEATLHEAQVAVRFENANAALARSALEEAQGALREANAEREMMRGALDEAQQALKREHSRAQYLGSIVEEAQSEERAGAERLREVEGAMIQARTAYNALNERYEGVQKKREALTLELHASHESGVQLKEKLEALQARLAQSATQNAPVSSLDEKSVAIEAMLRAEREEAERLRQEISHQQSQNEEMAELAMSHEKSLDRARGEIRQLRNRMIDLETQWRAASDDVKRLRAERAGAGHEVEQTDATRLRAKIGDLEQRLVEREERLRRLNIKLSNAGLA